MENNRKKTFVQKYWIYLILFIIVLILSAISIDIWYSNGNIEPIKMTIFDSNGNSKTINSYKFVYEHPILKILSVFLYSFSMTVLISLFIIKVIQKDEDEQRKIEDEKHKKELAENVFKGVFNRLLPQEIFDVLQTDILKANVVRRNVRWLYDFEIAENEIILKRNVMYEVHNVSDMDHYEPFSYTFSKTTYTSTEIKSLKWHDIEDKETTMVYYDTENKIKENLEHELGDNVEKVYKDISIPCKKARLINFISIEKHPGNINFLRDTHFSNACSIGWELHVNFPEEYDFNIMPLFSGNVQTVIEDSKRKQYAYNGGILKGQGIEFILSKKV